MTDPDHLLSDLRRPRLLVHAARHGVQDYRRERDLARLAPSSGPAPASALSRLAAVEAAVEATRCAGDARYSILRHIEILAALLAEARLSAAAALPTP